MDAEQSIRQETGAARPYVFLKEKYNDLDELSLAFAKNWVSAKRHLSRGLVDKYLATFNEEMASQCIGYKEMKDKNLAVFNLIYLLNPNAPLCYKGKLFNDMESLGQAMADNLPDIDPDIEEMIQNGALLQYVSENNFEPKLIQAVSEASKALNDDPKSYKYFTLMYFLNPGMGFEVNNNLCENLTDFIEYLESVNDTTRDRVADNLVENEIFFAWMDTLGYGEQVDSWREIYKMVEV